MAAEADKAIQQGLPAAPADLATASVADTPAVKAPETSQEAQSSGEKSEGDQAGHVGPVTTTASASANLAGESGPALAANGVEEGAAAKEQSSLTTSSDQESKPATAGNPTEVTEPLVQPTVPSTTEQKETNGTIKPVVAAPAPPPESSGEEPVREAVKDTAEKPTENAGAAAPTEQAPAADATVTAANGETREDDEMKEPAAAAETVTEDGATAPVGTGVKRKAEDAFGTEADAQRDLTEKKFKSEETVPVETSGTAPAAKKPGRPKKQTKAPAPVGRTARKTRSQGPVEV
ncbi:hypothetical protein VTK56DRAFT_7286 [Thermocarpiscus australiensis]